MITDNTMHNLYNNTRPTQKSFVRPYMTSIGPGMDKIGGIDDPELPKVVPYGPTINRTRTVVPNVPSGTNRPFGTASKMRPSHVRNSNVRNSNVRTSNVVPPDARTVHSLATETNKPKLVSTIALERLQRIRSPIVGPPVVGPPVVGPPVVSQPIVGPPVVSQPIVGPPVVGPPLNQPVLPVSGIISAVSDPTKVLGPPNVSGQQIMATPAPIQTPPIETQQMAANESLWTTIQRTLFFGHSFTFNLSTIVIIVAVLSLIVIMSMMLAAKRHERTKTNQTRFKWYI